MDKNWKVIMVGDVPTVRGDCFDPPRESNLWYVLQEGDSLPEGAQGEEVIDFCAEAAKQPPSADSRNSGINVSRLTFGF